MTPSDRLWRGMTCLSLAVGFEEDRPRLGLVAAVEPCAFIEGYGDFAKRMAAEEKSQALQKFEALIFSGMTPDPKNVPSQFDGLEVLLKAVKELKSG